MDQSASCHLETMSFMQTTGDSAHQFCWRRWPCTLRSLLWQLCNYSGIHLQYVFPSYDITACLECAVCQAMLPVIHAWSTIMRVESS